LSTGAPAGVSDDLVFFFPLQTDGQFHDYVLRPGQHPAWAGQTITALRLDPSNGARDATFAIDHIRRER
jgi:hypothetical protein